MVSLEIYAEVDYAEVDFTKFCSLPCHLPPSPPQPHEVCRAGKGSNTLGQIQIQILLDKYKNILSNTNTSTQIHNVWSNTMHSVQMHNQRHSHFIC